LYAAARYTVLRARKRFQSLKLIFLQLENWGGRASLKRALFMAALAARNHDSAMRAFFERLVHNGKPKMVTQQGR
jgi:hypothetical protein